MTGAGHWVRHPAGDTAPTDGTAQLAEVELKPVRTACSSKHACSSAHMSIHPTHLQQHAPEEQEAARALPVSPHSAQVPTTAHEGSSLGLQPRSRARRSAGAQQVSCRNVSSRAHPRPVIASSFSEPEAKASTLGRPRRPAPFSRVLSRLCSLPEFLCLGAPLCTPLVDQGPVAVRAGAVHCPVSMWAGGHCHR